jgi:hypothetical protein
VVPLALGAAAFARVHFASSSDNTTQQHTQPSPICIMKLLRIPRLIRGQAAAVGGFALFTGALQAAPFTYSPGDLVLAFRKSGSASDLVVNVGKATNYNNLPQGTTIPVSNLAAGQLNAAFANLNSLAWSVAAANRPPLVAGYPLQTLWITAPRLDSNTPSAPWLRKGVYGQGNTAGQIDGIGVNAVASSSSQSSNANNTAVGVVIPVSSDYAVKPVIGDGNYLGTFQGNAEAITAAAFAANPNNVSRSDLYELLPGSLDGGTLDTPGRYLGYFEFKPDGSLTFNTSQPPPPQPRITGIVRAGDVTTVSFTTVSSATYRLRYTDEAGLTSPVSTWSVGASTTGDGSVKSLDGGAAGENRFFAVDAQR